MGNSDAHRQCFQDGLHPNDQGFTLLTSNLIAEGILDLLPINTDPSTFSPASFPTLADISQELIMEMRCPVSANLNQTIPQVLMDAYEITSGIDQKKIKERQGEETGIMPL